MRKVLIIAAFLLSLPIVAFGQNAAYHDIVLGGNGQPLGGATVTVCASSATGTPCSPMVAIYNAASIAIANPTTTDGLGNVSFWAPPGSYQFCVSGNAVQPYCSFFSVGQAGPTGPAGSVATASSGSIGGNFAIKGPRPWRDFTSYMTDPATGNQINCSSTTPVNGADTTGTINSGTTTLTLAAARDFKNGCGVTILGAGPTSTLPAPPTTATVASAARSGGNVTLTFTGTPPAGLPVPFGGVPNGFGLTVTGCSDSSYNAANGVLVQSATGGSGWTLSYFTGGGNSSGVTSCAVSFIFGYVHGVAGSTTYKYQVAVCDLNFGCSPASSTLTITSANATLTKNNYNYISYPENTSGAYWLLYSDKGLGGALTCVNVSVTMAMIDIGGYNPCPAWVPTNPPGAATAQALFTTISAGAGTTSLTLANAASNNATAQNVYHDESSFLNSCITDANNDTNINSTTLGGGYGCYVPQGVYGINGPLKTATLVPNATVNIQVAGTLFFQTEPWAINSGYQIIGGGSGAQGGTVGQHKAASAIKFGGSVPYGFVFGTGAFSASVKGFQIQYINGTGVFIGATNYSNGTSGVSVEDMTVVNQNGTAPCLTIDDNNIGTYVNNFSCQAGSAPNSGMPCVYITHTPFGSLVNQILRFNSVNCTWHGMKIDGPGGNAGQAAIHDILWTDSFTENLPNADFGMVQLDNGGANGGGGWALQGMSLDHVLVSDSTTTGTFIQMSPTQNMPISAIEIKNSYTAGTGATCAVVTICQQFPIGNIASLGVGSTNFPSGQSGITLGGSGNDVMAGREFGIVPGTANIGSSPATDMPFKVFMPPLTANLLNSTGAGSLAAGTYCSQFTGLDANLYEGQPTGVRCDTVGASSDIVYDFGGPGSIFSAQLFSAFNFYYCFVASGTCTPNKQFTSISTSTDGGSGRLYTFSTTAGAATASPPAQGAAMMSWLAEDPTNAPFSCFMCVNSSSDAWPIGIGLNSTTLSGIANKGINLFTQRGVGMYEGAAPTGVATLDELYADSTAHQFKMKNNNGSADLVGDAIVEYCGATSGGTQACAQTRELNPIIIFGDVLLNTATSQSITALPFTSSSSYSCSGSDLTSTGGIVSFNTYAAASVTIQELNGTTSDHLRYVCAGF